MLKKGTVSSVDYDLGTVRLTFKDYDTVSDSLVVLQGRTTGDKDYSMPIIGEEGWCILESNTYNGVYLGGCYSEDNPVPTGAGKGVNIKEYSDGTKIVYNSNIRKMTIETVGDIDCYVNGSLSKYVSNNIETVATTINTSGSWNHEGTFTVSGIIKSLVDFVVGSLSMSSHKHKDAENRDTTGPM